MINLHRTFLFVVSLVLPLAFGATADAGERCPEVPSVSWWGDTSVEGLTAYVDRKHGGDWKAYIDKWNKQLEKMKSLSERDGTAVFKSRNLKLKGEALLQYIDAIKDRLSVTKCLARRELVNSGRKKSAAANDG